MSLEHELILSVLICTVLVFLLTIACTCFAVMAGQARARLRVFLESSL